MQIETPTPGAWPTPTFYPTTDATAVIDLPEDITYEIAEEVVQGYNRYPVGDYFEYALILLLAVAGVWSITRRLQRM